MATVNATVHKARFNQDMVCQGQSVKNLLSCIEPGMWLRPRPGRPTPAHDLTALVAEWTQSPTATLQYQILSFPRSMEVIITGKR